MNLILLEQSEATDPTHVRLSGTRANHLRTVLKAAPGSTVRVGIVDGPHGVGTVTSIASADISLRCTFDARIPPRPLVDLLLALPRPKVLKRLWAQLAALGVGRIMITNAVRVERNYFDTHVLEPSLFRPLLIEGLQQARDTRLPVVTVHRQLKVFLEDELGQHSDGARLYADPGSAQSVASALSTHPGRRVLLAVGPEGGWTDYERQMLVRHGFEAVAMGLRTLRSDTACISLLALVHAHAWPEGREQSSARSR